MYTIGKAAKLSGLSIDTIRYYEKEGMLSVKRSGDSKYRLFDQSVIARLHFIKRAKGLGFSLQEIKDLLLLNDGTGERQMVREIATHRLTEIATKISELDRIRSSLQSLVSQCDGSGAVDGCPIIQNLLIDDSPCESDLPITSESGTPKKCH